MLFSGEEMEIQQKQCDRLKLMRLNQKKSETESQDC